MSNDFGLSVLNKHGLFVLFDVESPARLASTAASETCAGWSSRVLKKESSAVLVCRPCVVDSQVLPATSADEQAALKELLKDAKATIRPALNRRDAVEIQDANQETAQAAMVPVKELRAMLEGAHAEHPLDVATKGRFLDKPFPLEVISRRLLRRQQAVGCSGLHKAAP